MSVCTVVLVVMGGAFIYHALFVPFSAPVFITLFLGSIAVLLFIGKWVSEWKGDVIADFIVKKKVAVEESWLITVLKAIKQRVCPLITIQ